ncbi:ras GEF [Coprinopsis marcescibilis]|uniref:Ras GEF n=1 Tax=Coprinopsis marcescibilis TaxID=230819 RepID=A0A5C3KJV4_COPMA|nr:ras GEF [Coprinopsis marcescibilis]
MLALSKAGLYDNLYSAETLSKKPTKPSKSKKKDKAKEATGSNQQPTPAKPPPSERIDIPTPKPIPQRITLESLSRDQPPTRRIPQAPPPERRHELEKDLPVVFCRAQHSYQAETSSGLSFEKGDVMKLISKHDSGWWDVLAGQKRGWVPSNYVTIFEDDEDVFHFSEPESPPTSPEYSGWTSESSYFSESPDTSPTIESRLSSDSMCFPPGLMDIIRMYDPEATYPSEWRKSSLSSDSQGTVLGGRLYESSLISFPNDSKSTLKGGSSSRASLDFSVLSDRVQPQDQLLFDPRVYSVDKLDKNVWYMDPTYTFPDIVVDEDGSIRGGTLPALVERLTAHDQLADRTFTRAFLMTFKTFTSADGLVDALIQRFRIIPPPGMSSSEHEKWAWLKQHIVQVRVLNVFKHMVQDGEILETEDLHVIDKIQMFLQWNDVEHLDAAKVLTDLIQRRRSGKFRTLVSTKSSIPPAPSLPKAGKRIKFLAVEPLELARQLTIIEAEMFQRIRPNECLNRARFNNGNTDNIALVIQMSNKISEWVAELILSKDDPWKRGQIVKHCISTADRCRKLTNFSTMFAIVSGLNGPPIRRLQETWGHVSKRSMDQLTACETILDSKKNFSNYRQLMARVVPPCVPFIGVFLTTLQFVQDGNLDELPSGVINFRKRQKFADVIGDIKRWQAYAYNFQRVPQILDFIQEELMRFGNEGSSSDRFWDLSLEREPRGGGEENGLMVQDSWFLSAGREMPKEWVNDEACAFCRIIRGELAASVVYETDRVIAILDILPLREGHTLVIPKYHCSRVSELPAEFAGATGEAVSKVAQALTKALDHTGLNVVCNQEYAQVVPHVHYHVIPAPGLDKVQAAAKASASGAGEPKVDLKDLKSMHRIEFESRSELDDDDAVDFVKRVKAHL